MKKFMKEFPTFSGKLVSSFQYPVLLYFVKAHHQQPINQSTLK